MLLIAIAVSIKLLSQDTIPHMQGTIILSVKKGTIACDLTLSHMPHVDDYYLRLNSGMNLRYIKNAEGTTPLPFQKSSQDTLSSGESSAYYIPAFNPSGKYLPHAVRLNYVGMYPVITDTSSVEDWRGNIAFNGTTLRADGIQSAWCPILYDAKTDTRYEKVTYDLDITCDDCQVIYLNGSQPVTGTHAILKSASSQDLTLFAGDYKSTAINGSYFLNADANETELAQLEKGLHACQDFLEQKLGIPYKGRPVYILTTPVSKHNAWQFASYPTIVTIGWNESMKAYINKNNANTFRLYAAHELAHYYFGTYRNFNSELGDAIAEGFAEFIAFNVSKTVVSDSAYREKLKAKVRALQNFKPLPFAGIHSANDYKNRELYVYYYAPLIFLAIQQEIGDSKMWLWMKSLLQAPTLFTNYDFVQQSLAKVINDAAKFKQLRENYFESDLGLQKAIARLNIPADQPASLAENKQATQTYYYFSFSGPMLDAGSPQNHWVQYTAIGTRTCAPSELGTVYESVYKKMHDQCENEGGCSFDFNTYDSMEKAKSALLRWQGKFSKYNGMLMKEVKTGE